MANRGQDATDSRVDGAKARHKIGRQYYTDPNGHERSQQGILDEILPLSIAPDLEMVEKSDHDVHHFMLRYASNYYNHPFFVEDL